MVNRKIYQSEYYYRVTKPKRVLNKCVRNCKRCDLEFEVSIKNKKYCDQKECVEAVENYKNYKRDYYFNITKPKKNKVKQRSLR